MRVNDLIDTIKYADHDTKKKMILGTLAGAIFLVAAILIARPLLSSGPQEGSEAHRRFSHDRDQAGKEEMAAIEQRRQQREQEAERVARVAGHDATVNGKRQMH